MSAWDRPPMTRRELRERERKAAAEAAARSGGTPEAPVEDAERAARESAQARTRTDTIQPGHGRRALQTERPQWEVPVPAGPGHAVDASGPATATSRPVARAATDSASTAGGAGATSASVASAIVSRRARRIAAAPAQQTVVPSVSSTPVASSNPVTVSVPSTSTTASAPMAASLPASPSPTIVDPVEGHRRHGGVEVVGTASSTIVLPELPRVPDMTGPLTSAGEVLVTGTIDLPASLAETGEHPRNVYHPDGAVDGGDDHSAAFRPVSATHAIGVYAAPHTITPEVRRESRLVRLLPYIAGAVAVVAVALVVAGFVFHVF